MSDFLTRFAEAATFLIEALGVAVITLTTVHVLYLAVSGGIKRQVGSRLYRDARHRLGLGILLGLELLVAGDIIHTVAVELTFTSVGVLAAIVLIRTFLSITMTMELEGHWPWQSKPESPQEKH